MTAMGTMKLELTKEEKRAFAIVDEILDTIQSCGEEFQAMSVENGDVVDFSEIARVRGVLSCFASGGDYDITKTEKPSIYEDETMYPNPLAYSDEELPLVGGDKAWKELMRTLGIC